MLGVQCNTTLPVTLHSQFPRVFGPGSWGSSIGPWLSWWLGVESRRWLVGTEMANSDEFDVSMRKSHIRVVQSSGYRRCTLIRCALEYKG